MPIALLIEILQGITALAMQLPDVIALAEDGIAILKAGSVTPAQEAAIRAGLDAVKTQIDES